jgi:uncharacterized protein (TIGR00266 family)
MANIEVIAVNAPYARVNLAQGEAFIAESGAMMMASAGIEIDPVIGTSDAEENKGFFSRVKSAIMSGESLVNTRFSAPNGPATVMLAPALPGELVVIDVVDRGLKFLPSAWMAHVGQLQLEGRWQRTSVRNWLLSDAGGVQAELRGQGQALLGAYGSIVELAIAPGRDIVLELGHLLAYDETVSVDVVFAEKGKRLRSMFAGVGLTMRLSGEGRVWVQTRNLRALESWVESVAQGVVQEREREMER